MELARYAAHDEHRENGPQEAVVAQHLQHAVGLHVLAHALAEHQHEHDGKAGQAAPRNGVHRAAFDQTCVHGVHAGAQHDAGFDSGRNERVELLR